MIVNGPIATASFENANKPSEDLIGAQASFIGKVRADSVNKSQVKAIEFTAQTEIAERVAGEIIEYSKKTFGILKAEIRHSVGIVPVGEPCFMVVVSAKHRKESFRALEYIVDEVKRQCPIFGKEILNDGNYQWKTSRESIK